MNLQSHEWLLFVVDCTHPVILHASTASACTVNELVFLGFECTVDDRLRNTEMQFSLSYQEWFFLATLPWSYLSANVDLIPFNISRKLPHREDPDSDSGSPLLKHLTSVVDCAHIFLLEANNGSTSFAWVLPLYTSVLPHFRGMHLYCSLKVSCYFAGEHFACKTCDQLRHVEAMSQVKLANSTWRSSNDLHHHLYNRE